MQDLTPQLRTRLSRVEHAVGLFVLLAALMLLAGFFYYLYHTAKRKGWFLTRVTYYTLTDTAAGLKVGDPVKLWGFDVGEITRIDSQPVDELFNVYVEFQVKAPYFGYLWTGGSRARVTPGDFLGKRYVEVTKGTNYTPTHLVWDIKEYAVRDALLLENLATNVFLDAIPAPGTNEFLTHPMQPLNRYVLRQLAAARIEHIRVADRAVERNRVTMMWDDRAGAYRPFTKKSGAYWLPPLESPALLERLEGLVGQVHSALPGIFSLTNQLAEVLSNTVGLTARADGVLAQARPVLTNLEAITTRLSQPGAALGEWLIPDNLHAQLLTTLTNANGTLTNASSALAATQTNLVFLLARLDEPLRSLSTIISNLNTQVQANTNFVTTLSSLVSHTDDLIQGFKRHWFLRSAFRERPTNAPSAKVPTSKGRR